MEAWKDEHSQVLPAHQRAGAIFTSHRQELAQSGTVGNGETWCQSCTTSERESKEKSNAHEGPLSLAWTWLPVDSGRGWASRALGRLGTASRAGSFSVHEEWLKDYLREWDHGRKRPLPVKHFTHTTSLIPTLSWGEPGMWGFQKWHQPVPNRWVQNDSWLASDCLLKSQRSILTSQWHHETIWTTISIPFPPHLWLTGKNNLKNTSSITKLPTCESGGLERLRIYRTIVHVLLTQHKVLEGLILHPTPRSTFLTHFPTGLGLWLQCDKH